MATTEAAPELALAHYGENGDTGTIGFDLV